MQPRRIGSDPGAGTRCPGRDDVASFVDGNLSLDQEEAMRAHIEVCASCRRLVAQIGAGGTGSAPHLASAPPIDEPPRTREAGRDDVIGPGALIGGKYRVSQLIGAGGMGKVFAALHVDLGHTLAIKVMHPEMARDADSVKRFLREGRAAALLKSDHAARINDVGRLPSGVPFLVMEYLEGEDLDRRRKRAPMSVDEVVDCMLQALAAIIEAHAAGLVHRDIKPQNLFLARLPDGRVRVKVLDFGLAKELPTLNRANSALTTDNMILGSPHFMSPEQIRNPMTVDGRTDIWAVGATMFMLLTNRAPFTSNTTHGLLARILAEAPPHARELRPDIPLALDAILDRCMAKDVSARYQTVTELSAALRELSTGEGSLASTRAEKARAQPPPTVVDIPPFTMASDDVDEPLASTRVRPISNPAIATQDVPGAPPQTMLAAGGYRETVPMPTQHAGVPPTAPMGAFPMAPALLATMPSPIMRAEEPRAPRPVTLQSEQLPAPSLSPAPPSESFAQVAEPQPRASASRRAATIALVLVTLAATVVVVFVIRAPRAPASKVPAAQHGDVRAVDLPAAVSATSDPPALAVSSGQPAAPELTSQSPIASASSAPVTVKKPPPVRTAVPGTPTVPSPAKDPYSWGK